MQKSDVKEQVRSTKLNFTINLATKRKSKVILQKKTKWDLVLSLLRNYSRSEADGDSLSQINLLWLHWKVLMDRRRDERKLLFMMNIILLLLLGMARKRFNLQTFRSYQAIGSLDFPSAVINEFRIMNFSWVSSFRAACNIEIIDYSINHTSNAQQRKAEF